MDPVEDFKWLWMIDTYWNPFNHLRGEGEWQEQRFYLCYSYTYGLNNILVYYIKYILIY